MAIRWIESAKYVTKFHQGEVGSLIGHGIHLTFAPFRNACLRCPRTLTANDSSAGFAPRFEALNSHFQSFVRF